MVILLCVKRMNVRQGGQPLNEVHCCKYVLLQVAAMEDRKRCDAENERGV